MMLPDYIDTKEQLQNLLNRWLRRRVREHLGPLGEIPRQRLFEGSQTSFIRPDNQEDLTTMQTIESQFEVSLDEVPSLTFSEILQRLDRVAQEMADQQGKHIYTTISEASERVGNVVRATGKITPEAILEVFEKIEITFNEKGQPEFPSIHIHPDMAETVKEALGKLEKLPEYRRRFEEILARKKDEWRVREANRKLVG